MPSLSRRLSDIFSLDEQGKITEILKIDGTAASDQDLQADAEKRVSHFALDDFNNHCSNREHDCAETCIKYAKKKLEAKQSLRSHMVPSCRFWFFCI